MPRASALRGLPAAVLTSLAPHSVILVRDGVVTTAQSVFLDFSATGRETVFGTLGVGDIGEANGVAIYCPTAVTIEVGDVFRHGDHQYTVEYVSPQGWTVVDGSAALRLAWARVQQGRGT